MRHFVISFFFFLCTQLAFSQSNTGIAIQFIKQMERAQFDSCYKLFDTVVTNKINSEMLKQMWESIPRFTGDYIGYSDIRSEKKDTTESVFIRCAFEKTKMDLALSFNQEKKIIGIFFLPPKNAATYEMPEYNKSHKYYETKLSVKTGTLEMPGILLMPNVIENPPVVILLGGSGPTDKDGTVGPNKVLKDIAVGLSSMGIATYRFDKRTIKYGSEIQHNISKFGIEQEVIEDAISAVKLIKNYPNTKYSKIFIAGHSLGAYCAPLVAKNSKDVLGIILLAGNARPLEDLILEQYTYIYSLDSIDSQEKAELKKIEEQVARVKNTKLLKASQEKDLPLNLNSYYWQSLKKYDHIKTAKSIKQPVLVLQGERDYQVTMKDYEIWTKELSSNTKNKFISYPKLNHLFISGDSKSIPEEYDKPGHVDEAVIKSMVDFISNH
jgi:dienelactone hydrolase